MRIAESASVSRSPSGFKVRREVAVERNGVDQRLGDAALLALIPLAQGDLPELVGQLVRAGILLLGALQQQPTTQRAGLLVGGDRLRSAARSRPAAWRVRLPSHALRKKACRGRH